MIATGELYLSAAAGLSLTNSRQLLHARRGGQLYLTYCFVTIPLQQFPKFILVDSTEPGVAGKVDQSGCVFHLSVDVVH